jgi:hypothetical protein
MIIGDAKIDYENLKRFVGRPDDLVTYAENQVPIWARHIKCLAQNQRFYIAIHLRGVLTISYKVRMELVNALVDGIIIKGVISTFTPINDIIDTCNKEALIAMIEQRIENNV